MAKIPTNDQQRLIDKGRRAKELLDNPFLAEVYNQIKNDLLVKLVNTELNESKKREGYYYLLRALVKIHHTVTEAARMGEYTEGQILNPPIEDEIDGYYE